MSTTDRYPVAELDNLPEDIRRQILDVQEKSGFVPNVFIKLARRPDEYRAFFAYHDALMLREGRVVDAGPVEDVVTAETLSETFGMALLLRERRIETEARTMPST